MNLNTKTIEELQSQLEDLKNQIEAHKEVDRELRIYLALDKFKDDTSNRVCRK